MKKLSLSVSDFALPSPRQGSIEVFSGFGQVTRLGIEIHQRVQARRLKENENYKAEVWTSQSFERGGFSFEVGGRMDGLYLQSPAKIEEIKSSFNIEELAQRLSNNLEHHPYCLQLKTYGYFHWLTHQEIPELNLHLVSARHEDEEISIPLSLDLQNYEEWLERRLQELVEEAKLDEKLIQRRKKSAKNLEFPFPNPRPSQVELMESIEKGLKDHRPMLIQAPTGLGKTMGVLYPTLQEALSRGQKVIYVTPKNSQHAAAENAIAHLQEKGTDLRSLTVTAKSKICMKSEPLCNPEYCEFAKDHYTKMAANQLPAKLMKKKNLRMKTFKTMAEQYQVCPFELQMEAANKVDTVICDYNYVFSPNASYSRLSAGTFQQKNKPNLVVDEAHNLPSRARDYFSPSLSVAVLEKMQEEAQFFDLHFRQQILALLDDCVAVIHSCGGSRKEAHKIDPPVESFLAQDQQIKSFLSNYLKSTVDIRPGDMALKLSFYWSEFTAALEFVETHPDEFFTTYQPSPATVKIMCCDASAMIADRYNEYAQIVAFSATLKPFGYYRRLMGFQNKEIKVDEFVSPFPKEQRKLIVIPQISSKYSERERNYPRIAETIAKIAALKKGNYFAFFPSFEFMQKVLQLFNAPTGFTVLRQERSMKKGDIADVLEKLADPVKAHILFAVQGGVFSEGVDYPGKMAIGAFVVGPPLPIFNFENEKMREYYEEHYSAGFDYTYTYPAMAKSIQAAGRVIRSETDEGVIILMDNRFLQPGFAQSMPSDWFDENPEELVSKSILNDVADFWEKR